MTQTNSWSNSLSCCVFKITLRMKADHLRSGDMKTGENVGICGKYCHLKLKLDTIRLPEFQELAINKL